MSHELLYTSARQGLTPGSYGFCTVIATEGLPKVLQDRLESLSGYEPAFALTDQRVHLNPVNYSYLIVTVANQKLHLLSRIADAGADYSGRSNKIAHHVALLPSELTSAGPASVLAAPDFCKTNFEGKPRWLPVGVKPTLLPRLPGKCSAWEAVCKDAGWAGVLVEQTLKNPSRPITIIFAPGCDVLPLVLEAMSLLPLELQWRTTFSTFFTKLPAGIDCQWRFALDGTPAADQARRNLHSLVIDLTSAGRAPFEGPAVEMARTGDRSAILSAIGPPPTPVSVTTKAPPSLPTSVSRDHSVHAGIAPYKLGPLPKSMRGSNAKSGVPMDDPFAKRGMSGWTIGGIIVGSAAAVALAVGALIYLTPRSPESMESDATSERPHVADNKEEKPSILDNHVDVVQEPQVAQLLGHDAPIDPAPPTEPVNKEDVKPTDVPLPPVDVFKDIKAKGAILALPKRDLGVSFVSADHEICKIVVKEGDDFQLKLITTELLKDGKPRFVLVPELPQDDHTKSWNARSQQDKTPGGIDVEPQKVGTFTLKGQSLTFEWSRECPEWASPFDLLLCKLEIRLNDDSVQCGLFKPTTVSAEKVAFNSRVASLPVQIPAATIKSVDSLRYDIELRLDGWIDFKSGLTVKDKLKFEVPTGRDSDTDVDLEVQFAPDPAHFNYSAFVYLNYLDVQGGQADGRSSAKRSDRLGGSARDGFIMNDLERIRKKASDDQSKASRLFAAANTQLRERKSELSDALKLNPFLDEKNPYQAAVDEAEKTVDEYKYALEKGIETIKWTRAMETRLRAIESKLEIRFTIYAEFGGEKVVLVQTDPPPSKPTN